MRVAIVGAGAVGSALAASLRARNLAEVELVARGAQLRALQAGGLRVTGMPGIGAEPLHIPAVARLTRSPDHLVFATKTQDLDAACAEAAKALRGTDQPTPATVVTLQNGLRADAIAAEHFGPAAIVGCVTDVVAEAMQPGELRVGRMGGFVVGRPQAPADREAHRVAALFEAAGWVTWTTDNLEGARWLKLLVNLNNALAAATGKPVGELYEDPRIAALAARMLKEGWRVARAEGVLFEALPWVSPGMVRALAVLPVPLAARVLRGQVRRRSRGVAIRGSTLQSIFRGKPTEIEFLNGEVVARGTKLGVPTPVNAALVEAVRAVEAGGGFFPVDALVSRLAAAR